LSHFPGRTEILDDSAATRAAVGAVSAFFI